MLCQGAQALDPAAAHGWGRPGRSSQGACLPKQPGQQLPLLGIREASGDLSTCPGRRFCGSEAGEAPLWGNLLVSCRPKGLWAAVLLGGGRWPQSASTADAAFQGREPQAKNWAGHVGQQRDSQERYGRGPQGAYKEVRQTRQKWEFPCGKQVKGLVLSPQQLGSLLWCEFHP